MWCYYKVCSCFFWGGVFVRASTWFIDLITLCCLVWFVFCFWMFLWLLLLFGCRDSLCKGVFWSIFGLLTWCDRMLLFVHLLDSITYSLCFFCVFAWFFYVFWMNLPRLVICRPVDNAYSCRNSQWGRACLPNIRLVIGCVGRRLVISPHSDCILSMA